MTANPTRLRRGAMAAALIAGTALVPWVMPAVAQGTAPPAATVSTPLPGFADLVERVRPAVVTITTTARVQAEQPGSPFPPGSPPDRRFGRFFEAPERPDAGRAMHALGSGFLVDAAGHVVTNNHVVADAAEVRVTLADGRELLARVVGTDPRTDLALLQVDAGGAPLPHLSFGNSDAARVGDWVIAVGNPFGLGGTVTAGILSARGRQIGEGPYDDFLQVDAPINRGNSGGPLLAQDGTVIGVNTAIFSPSGGSVGIGFAIPAGLVRQVVGELEARGRVERGRIGVSAQAVTPGLASALRLPRAEGALVSAVEADSPAAAAGLQPGDVVVAVGGAAVHTPRDLARLVAGTHPGSRTELLVHREGGDRTLTVSVAELREAAAGGKRQAAAEAGSTFGLALAPLDPESRDALGLPEGQRGVVVAGVRPSSPADEAGLHPGDLVQAVGNQAVSSPEQAATLLRDAGRTGGDAVALRVLREGQSTFVALRLPGPPRG